MSIPAVLLSNVKNESQNVEVTTDVLEQNQHLKLGFLGKVILMLIDETYLENGLVDCWV